MRERLRTRFERQRSAWLKGEGAWPLSLPLGVPTETEAEAQTGPTIQWVDAWRNWPGPGAVRFVERCWSRLGRQVLPHSIRLASADEVAAFIGREAQWRQALVRLARVRERWPSLQDAAARSWDVLAEWPDDEFERLVALLAWLETNPASNLLPRQLPVPGVHSKWLEGHRRILMRWLGAIRQCDTRGVTLEQLTGLRVPPERLRLRVLDPVLRGKLAGLADVEAPVDDIAAWSLPARVAFIVENLQTGLAFGDLPGAVVFMQQGYAVDVFGRIPWLAGLPVFYWGDLDTHGFAILDRLRGYLPHVRSLLMDEATLIQYRALWTREDKPYNGPSFSHLTKEESRLVADLQSGKWGHAVRLEQERIEWSRAWESILSRIGE
ncbi:MAG TPA: hypothetical protein ENK53_05760 [Thiotrichales bacterium]|nr:hypothetical protein [Thiotrichales bacterium]